jgi:hypothetical protein
VKLREFFEKGIQTGIKNDPRGRQEVLDDLKRRKKEYGKLKGREKEFFDAEGLKNPYADSRILWGAGTETLRRVMVGIDVEVGEILLANSLRERGERIDALVAHHPEGRAFADLHLVMQMQAEILNRFGIPISTAESLMEERISTVERKLLPANHARAVDAARLMGIPLLNFHTPADNMVATHLQKLFEQKKPHDLDEIMELLLEIPEYREAAKAGAGPKIIVGSKKRKAGGIFVDMTGGTEGAQKIFRSMAQSGINTVVGMHFSEEHRKEANAHHLNIVVAGHISSDNLGMNLLLDEVCRGTKLQVVECSGFVRVKRR